MITIPAHAGIFDFWQDAFTCGPDLKEGEIYSHTGGAVPFCAVIDCSGN